jgi:GTP-binding protein
VTEINFNTIKFITSVPYMKGLPAERGIEIAFAGRSNAGKSSALNAMANRKSMAKTSSVPGKTQHINLFSLKEDLLIADLPGYGYAKVPPREKKRWQEEMTNYILNRECLKGIILLMDIRHPLTDLDRAMLDLAVRGNREVHIVLSKADKLKSGARAKTLSDMNKALRGLTIPWSIQTLSAVKKDGVKELQDHIRFWYESD